MAVSSDDEEIDSIITSFDQICQDFKTGIQEMNSLRSNLTTEINKREALEIACNDLKAENERLSKLYTGSLNNLVEDLDRRTKCESLKEELKRVQNECLVKEDEYRKAVQGLECDYRSRIQNFEAQIIGLQQEKAANETTINHLRLDLAAHKSHVQALASRLEKVRYEVESNYNAEIQDLKDCLMIEQEEKRELNKKLQDLEKELLINKTRLVEQEQDIGSAKHVETLKLKITKLRKEHEILKRKVSH